jgi:hypothetical protein
MCSFLLEGSKDSVCELKNWEALDFNKKVPLFMRAMALCSNRMESFSKEIADKNEQIKYLQRDIIIRLDTIDYHIFKIKITSFDSKQSLMILQHELNKVNKIKNDLDRLGQRLEDLGIYQQKSLFELQENMPRILDDLANIAIASNQNDNKMQDIIKRLQILKKSRVESCFDQFFLSQIADVISIIGVLLAFMPASS